MDSIQTNHLSVTQKSFATWWLLIPFCLILFSLSGCHGDIVGMFNPKGIIAFQQRRLFVNTLALMLIVVLPVIVMSFTFVYHYQVSHRVRDYKPNWSHSLFLETLWWAIPFIIIFVLGFLTWKKTYELDPFNKISGSEPTIPIQVIALPWKWLFIYPLQDIATINYLMIPVGQQVEFSLTNDNVPMSAFFIPQLGSQIYTMAGMRSRLHLLANQAGTFDGMSTNFNGEGFSDMRFSVEAVTEEQMLQWVNEVKKSSNHLTDAAYRELLIPTIADQPKVFSGVVKNLFENVITLYMCSLGGVHPRSTTKR